MIKRIKNFFQIFNVIGFFSPIIVLSIFIVISGPLLSVTSMNLFGVWLGLEVNLFAFLIIINFDGY